MASADQPLPEGSLEIEKKYPLLDGDEERIAQRLRFVKEKTFRDVYFDIPVAYKLLTRDWWLRSRAGTWELKIPSAGQERRPKGTTEGSMEVETYEEVSDPPELASRLGLRADGAESLTAALDAAGYRPFVDIETTRRTYEGEYRGALVHVDVDRINFGYDIIEIEVMGSTGDAALARTKSLIADLGRELGLTERPVRGKVLEYIVRHLPEHYAALRNVGLVVDRPPK